MMRDEAFVAYHSPSFCGLALCAHAVAENVPCQCPDCDKRTRLSVTSYREEHAQKNAGMQSQNTPRYVERTFERFIIDTDNSAAYDAAKAVVDDPSRGLGLYGSFGVGKSHLGAAIANGCKARGIGAIYIGVEELLANIRATYDAKGGNTEHAMIRSCATIPVLVLDDLGKEALTDWTVRTLFSLVNRRYEQSLPLVVTTNHAPTALWARKVGKDAEALTYASTMDRVGEMTKTWVEISGRSRR